MFRGERRVFAGVAEAVGGELVEVAGGTAGLGGLPAGVEEAVLGEAHEDGIEGAGLEAGEPAEVVSISPFLRSVEEFGEHESCLRRSA
jgi:hypothetical protein